MEVEGDENINLQWIFENRTLTFQVSLSFLTNK